MLHFTYNCIRVRQDPKAKDLLLFSASAIDIDSWIGIPQRLVLAGRETAGFQRTVSARRETALRHFFADSRNVIQNPLLAAVRQAPGTQVEFIPSKEFIPSNDGSQLGTVRITFEDLATLPLTSLLTLAREQLEIRVPQLSSRPLPTALIADLEAHLDPSAFGSGLTDSARLAEEAPLGEEDKDLDDDAETEAAEEALFDESQITDFWDQLRAREEIAKKFPVTNLPNQLHGFSRDILEAYLRPVILVDGQHRLRGAVLATRDEVDASDEAQELIFQGQPADQVRKRLTQEKAPRLPVSLLMDESPAEHVFQYVVVNQKATPVPRALLGTIISTSLASEELSKVAERLEQAEIDLEGSKVISVLSRAADSPFIGLVAKGLNGESNKLPWTVLGSLAEIFRRLEGAKYYHENTDHAKIWRQHHLVDSPIVQDWQARDFQSPLAYWADLNGPWMDVFKTFWQHTRDKLADPKGQAAPNAWGNARDSNIFNKPSLHILTADFFAFLKEQRVKLRSTDHVIELVDQWLEYVDANYFSRDWKLSGVKKDSVGIRRQWSKLWVNHRQAGGTAPAPSEFSKLFKV